MTTPFKIVCLLLVLTFFSCRKNEFANANDKITISFDGKHLNGKEKEKYLDSIFNLLKDQNNDSVTRNLHFKLSTEYYYNKNPKKSLAASLEVLRLSKEVTTKKESQKHFIILATAMEM